MKTIISFLLLIFFNVASLKAQQLIAKTEKEQIRFSVGDNVVVYAAIPDGAEMLKGKIKSIQSSEIIITGFRKNSKINNAVSVEKILGVKRINRTGRTIGSTVGTLLFTTGTLLLLDVFASDRATKTSDVLPFGLIGAGVLSAIIPRFFGTEVLKKEGYRFVVE